VVDLDREPPAARVERPEFVPIDYAMLNQADHCCAQADLALKAFLGQHLGSDFVEQAAHCRLRLA
jgi:hypothetical protein